MKKAIPVLVLYLLLSAPLPAQYYFPPSGSDIWESTDPADLGWCTGAIPPLYDFLEEKNTKAFIVLKDGKIVLEQYFNGHAQDSAWYWASAGKTLTAFLTGIAQQEGSLDINDPTADYLGQGWTNCSPEEENAITIRHQLTMTSAMDDSADSNCSDPDCLNCIATPGERWSYHNAPYRLLHKVIEAATGTSYNLFTFQKLLQPTGMSGIWLIGDEQLLFLSKARHMARFGSLIMNDGAWGGSPIMTDPEYFEAMVSPSQNLNKSYGYLWWLNGQESFMLPTSQLVFPGPLSPDAPDDLVAAIGKNGQILNVVPSEGLVLVRMGELPGDDFVPTNFQNEIWEKLNAVICSPTAAKGVASPKPELEILANPFSNELKIKHLAAGQTLRLIDFWGREVAASTLPSLDTSHLPVGIYFLNLLENGKVVATRRVVK